MFMCCGVMNLACSIYLLSWDTCSWRTASDLLSPAARVEGILELSQRNRQERYRPVVIVRQTPTRQRFPSKE
jgi:hypothetical protein